MDQSEIAKLAIEVIPGVVANGISSLFAHVGRHFSSSRIARTAERLSNTEPVRTVLQKATAATARQLEHDVQQLHLVKQFLISPELDAIIRQIYSAKITSAEGDYIGSIRKEFLVSLSLHTGLSKSEAGQLGDRLFAAIMTTCELALSREIDRGSLGALDAKSSVRHNIVLDQLGTIKRNLDLLSSKDRESVSVFLRFEEKYREQVGARHGYISAPNLSSAKKTPLDDLYVGSTFNRFRPRHEHLGDGGVLNQIKDDEFMARINRSVLLGNPGGGKSTFSLRVCHSLATRYHDRLVGGRSLTPILVVLRDYGGEKKLHHRSILEFIEVTANSKYQLKPPQNAMEYLLLNGRALVVFDGLDELLDASYRREISADVESFASLYPATPILVTSREVGYDQAPLDKRTFVAYRINEFDDSQVAEYAKKWFRTDEDFTAEQNAEMAESFLRESESVQDLRSNPLILGLMCNIYRGESYIPRNRPGVYEKCALMLFDRWDRSRHLDVQFTFEDKLNPVMKYLAFWIYSDPKLQTGVTESKLIDKATEYLHKRLYDDVDLARKVAREFIEFCRGRAWVFTDTGSTADGELLYQFTHRTFLEYFTAAQLIRVHPTPADLAPVLVPRIEKEEWDIVAQLAFQLQNNNVEGAGDQLLSAVLKRAATSAGKGQAALLSFAVRCLEFMLPSRKTVREIASEALAFVMKVATAEIPRQEKGQFLGSDLAQKASTLLGGLLLVAPENRPAIADVVANSLASDINSQKRPLAMAAFDIVRFFPLALERPRASDQAHAFWQSITAHVLEANRNKIRQLAAQSSVISRAAFLAGIITFEELLQWHGIGSLYIETPHLIYPTSYVPLGDYFAMPYHHEDPSLAVRQVETIGRFAVQCQPPWVQTRALGTFTKSRFQRNERWWSGSPDGNFTFGLFAFFATLLESTENRKSLQDTVRIVSGSPNSSVSFVRELLLARYTEDFILGASEAWSSLSSSQKQIVSDWAAKKISFVGGGKRKRR